MYILSLCLESGDNGDTSYLTVWCWITLGSISWLSGGIAWKKADSCCWIFTALVFLRTTKQTNVHILEANTRKARSPICNCFNIRAKVGPRIHPIISKLKRNKLQVHQRPTGWKTFLTIFKLLPTTDRKNLSHTNRHIGFTLYSLVLGPPSSEKKMGTQRRESTKRPLVLNLNLNLNKKHEIKKLSL